MIYPCFPYAFKVLSSLNCLVTYTTKQTISKYHKLRSFHEKAAFALNLCFYSLYILSAIMISVHDYTEFMEALVQSIFFMQIGLEFYVIYRNRYNLIELVNEMKCKFSTVDEKIVKECTRKENVYYWTFTGLVTIGKFEFIYLHCS